MSQLTHFSRSFAGVIARTRRVVQLDVEEERWQDIPGQPH